MGRRLDGRGKMSGETHVGGTRASRLGRGIAQRVAQAATRAYVLVLCGMPGCGPAHPPRTVAQTRAAPEAEPPTTAPSTALPPVLVQARIRDTAMLTENGRSLFRARAMVEGEGDEAGSHLNVEALFRARIRDGHVDLATEALGGAVAWHRACGSHWLFALHTGQVVVARGFLGDVVRRHTLESRFTLAGGDDTGQVLFAASTGQAFRVPCDGGDLVPVEPAGVDLIEGVWFVGALGVALVNGNSLLRTVDGGVQWESLAIHGGAGAVRVENGQFVVEGVADSVVIDVATGAQHPYAHAHAHARSTNTPRPMPVTDGGAIDYAILERYPSLYADLLARKTIAVSDGGAWVAVAHGRSVRVFERGQFHREFTPSHSCRDVSEVWRDRDGRVVIDCTGSSLVRFSPDGEATELASGLRKIVRDDGTTVRWQVDPEWRAMARQGRCASDSGGSEEGFVCWLDLETRSLREIAWPGAWPASVVAVRGAHVLAQSSDEAAWVTSDAAPVPVASERGARWILTEQAFDGFLWGLQRRGRDVVLVHHDSIGSWAVRSLPGDADIVGFARADLGVARSSNTGAVHVTRDGGAHWTPLSLPEGAGMALRDDELYRQARAELGPDYPALHHIACVDAHTCQWLDRWILAEAGAVPVVPALAIQPPRAPERSVQRAVCTMRDLSGDIPEEPEHVAAYGQVTAWFDLQRNSLRARWQLATARPVASRATRLPPGPPEDPWAAPDPPDMLTVGMVRGGPDWLVARVCASQCHMVLARPSAPLVYLAHGHPLQPSEVLDVAMVDSRLFVVHGGWMIQVTEFDLRGRALRERIYPGGTTISAFLGGEGRDLALVRVPWDGSRVLVAPLLDDARVPFVVDTTDAAPCGAGASGPPSAAWHHLSPNDGRLAWSSGCR